MGIGLRIGARWGVREEGCSRDEYNDNTPRTVRFDDDVVKS